MEKIELSSDGKKISLAIEGKAIIFKRNKSSLRIERTKSIYFGNRNKKYKPDLFFILYGILTVIFGIFLLHKFFSKNTGFLYIIVSFLLIATISFTTMIVAANKKQSLFIIYEKGTVEIPLDNNKEIEQIKRFFTKNGFNVSYLN